MLGAAGAIEAAVCALALRDQVLPPTVNVDESKALVHDVVPNKARAHDIETVLSNSFAFGGNNCSLVIGRRPRPVVARPNRRVVVTGAGVVSPIGVGRGRFVEALRSGVVGIGTARSLQISSCRSQLAAEISDTSYLQSVDPAYVRRLDQLGVLVLAASRMALKDAELRVTRANSERVGMVFGTYTGPLETVGALSETIGQEGPHRVNPRLFPNSVMNAAAGHACLSLQIRGPLSTLASGCAAGVIGMGYAADLVRRGEADAMLAVAGDELSPLLHLGYDRLGILTSDAVRPYDRDRDGCALGAGSVALVIESLDQASERGATILGEIQGHSVTSDAFRVAGNDPSGEAWAEGLRRALADAQVEVEDVGTYYGDARGTSAIDLAEARAISEVWRAGSVRVANLSGQVGHVHSTTPLLSMVAALETMSTGWVPPICGLRNPVPVLEGHVDSETEAGGRACVVTAANWGGTYASTVLGPWPN